MKRRERVARNVSAVLAVMLDQVGDWCHQVERFQVYCIIERGLEALVRVVEVGKEN